MVVQVSGKGKDDKWWCYNCLPIWKRIKLDTLKKTVSYIK